MFFFIAIYSYINVTTFTWLISLKIYSHMSNYCSNYKITYEICIFLLFAIKPLKIESHNSLLMYLK